MEGSLVSRDRYLAEIEPFVGNGNAKVITGVRRCGKSTLLKIYRQHLTDANVVYINTELHEFFHLNDWEKLLSYIESECREGTDNVLIVDEIQNIEKWELAIRDLIARKMFDILQDPMPIFSRPSILPISGAGTIAYACFPCRMRNARFLRNAFCRKRTSWTDTCA